MKLVNIAHFHRSRLRRPFEPAGTPRLTYDFRRTDPGRRGLLGWTRHELARRAVVSLLETARGSAANPSTLAAVRATLEAAGIEFLNGPAPGLRLHPKSGDDLTK
jgi:hypothetical protein